MFWGGLQAWKRVGSSGWSRGPGVTRDREPSKGPKGSGDGEWGAGGERTPHRKAVRKGSPHEPGVQQPSRGAASPALAYSCWPGDALRRLTRTVIQAGS